MLIDTLPIWRNTDILGQKVGEKWIDLGLLIII